MVSLPCPSPQPPQDLPKKPCKTSGVLLVALDGFGRQRLLDEIPQPQMGGAAHHEDRVHTEEALVVRREEGLGNRWSDFFGPKFSWWLGPTSWRNGSGLPWLLVSCMAWRCLERTLFSLDQRDAKRTPHHFPGRPMFDAYHNEGTSGQHLLGLIPFPSSRPSRGFLQFLHDSWVTALGA